MTHEQLSTITGVTRLIWMVLRDNMCSGIWFEGNGQHVGSQVFVPPSAETCRGLPSAFGAINSLTHCRKAMNALDGLSGSDVSDSETGEEEAQPAKKTKCLTIEDLEATGFKTQAPSVLYMKAPVDTGPTDFRW